MGRFSALYVKHQEKNPCEEDDCSLTYTGLFHFFDFDVLLRLPFVSWLGLMSVNIHSIALGDCRGLWRYDLCNHTFHGYVTSFFGLLRKQSSSETIISRKTINEPLPFACSLDFVLVLPDLGTPRFPEPTHTCSRRRSKPPK